MVRQAELIRANYVFTVIRSLRGSAAVNAGVATLQQQVRQSRQEREPLYVELEVAYFGSTAGTIGAWRFSLEDSEGYFIDAADPVVGAFSGELTPRGIFRGGLAFSLYSDLQPARLWFDTLEAFDDSNTSLLVPISLGPAPGQDASGAWQVTATRSLDQQSEPAGEVGPEPLDRAMALARLAKQLPWPYRRLNNGLMFRVALPGGRRQHVLMNTDGHDEDGSPLVRFLTICAPVDDGGESYGLFLRTNPRLAHGAIGIVAIEGRDFYVMTHTALVDSAQPDELMKTVGHLASWGDQIEARLTGGEDLR